MSAAPGDDPLAMPPAALAGLAELYSELEREIAALAPRCELSGRCCDFPRSGHVLYATDLELAHLRGTLPLRSGGDPALCPWWEQGRCTARDGRPLGCRLYFCDPKRQVELEALSLRVHARLKQLHDASGAAYRYSPFVRRVRELAAADPPR